MDHYIVAPPYAIDAKGVRPINGDQPGTVIPISTGLAKFLTDRGWHDWGGNTQYWALCPPVDLIDDAGYLNDYTPDIVRHLLADYQPKPATSSNLVRYLLVGISILTSALLTCLHCSHNMEDTIVR